MRNCSDDCDRYHCPHCGGHTLGYLEFWQKCEVCQLIDEANELNMRKFSVVINHKDMLILFRGDNAIGTVQKVGEENEPTLVLRPNQMLTFSELTIIQENWVEMEDMDREERIKNLKERLDIIEKNCTV